MQVGCNHCFYRFHSSDIHFKCPIDGCVFHYRESVNRRSVPASAPCPECRLLTAYKVCPECEADLPCYAGKADNKTIAVTGSRGCGKSIYITSLVYYLREIEGRSKKPRAAIMFEDDLSHQLYMTNYSRLVMGKQLLQMTDLPQVQGAIEPIVLRCLTHASRAKKSVRNLVFYDPPGELFSSLASVNYIRYLAYSSAVLFLVDPWETSADEKGVSPTVALTNIIRQIQRERGLGQGRIPQALSVVLTKYDQAPGGGGASLTSAPSDRPLLSEKDCMRLLETQGMSHLLSIAKNNFSKVSFFAVSSLGQEPNGPQLAGPISPAGVGHPFFWAIDNLE
jgi:hypothetical protein